MGFGFRNIEHAFSYVAQEIVKGAKLAAAATAHVRALEPVVEGATAVIDPPAVLIERAAFGLLGHAVKAANDIGDAAQAKGLNIQLDSESIRDLQQIGKYLHGHLATLGATHGTSSSGLAASAGGTKK